MGGGTCGALCLPDDEIGLSPRGRGNHRDGQEQRDGDRSIPAWAGEPYGKPVIGNDKPVYPRVGGGTNSPQPRTARLEGLSPRGRGNRPWLACRPVQARSIPAWAGEPGRVAPYIRSRGVYPRVGGGTAQTANRYDAVKGLSPRGRGNPCMFQRRDITERSIPAWAGEPSGGDVCSTDSGVYPRVGGGTDFRRTVNL